MDTPEELKYSKDHEWIRVDGDTGTVGITDYAQGELGDVVYVELPSVGDSVGKGESFGTIEAVKAVSELYSPLSGEVVEINESLEGEPALVNQSPYGDGWMIKIRIASTDEISDLMDASSYKEMVGA
jgi:glycine cleavage system H protein